jgi:hypothetical protein
MGATTTRLGLPYPFTSDANNVPASMQALAMRIDAIIPLGGIGVLASRPTVGNAGFTYFATDVANLAGTLGVYYEDNGTAWIPLNPAIAIGATPTNSAVGDSATQGVSTLAARADHKHGRETFAGSGSNWGTSTNPARSDHYHQLDGGRAYATNPGSISTSGAAAVATNATDWTFGAMTQGSGGLIVATPGVYLVSVQGNATGTSANDWLEAHIMLNGSAFRTGQRANDPNGAELTATCVDLLNITTIPTTINLGLLCNDSSMMTSPGTGASCWVSAYEQMA